jgi:uncharacterized protein
MADPEELFAAIEKGDTAKLRRVLKADPKLAEARNERGVTPLLFALYQGNDKAVEAIRKAAKNLSIFEAAAVGDIKRLKELLETNRSLVESFTPDGFQPLALAAFFKQPEAVRVLLDHDADPDVPARNDMKVTALHAAAAANDFDIVKMLVDANADVNAQQQGDFTALHAAAQHGNERMAQLLVDNGADSSLKAGGRTAAAIAREHKQKALAELIDDYQP